MFVANTGINYKHIALKHTKCFNSLAICHVDIPRHSYNSHNECDIKVNINLNDTVSTIFS